MKHILISAACCCMLLSPLSAPADPPALTIYNQNFAAVRDTVPLDLKEGLNDVKFTGMTATAETDSVVLRDPGGKVKLQVLEQSYRNDAVSQDYLLSLCEGKEIDFFVKEPNKEDHIVKGKVIRSGYGTGGQNPTQPIIEVNGAMQFSLPGEPRFTGLGGDTILNPTLSWKLNASTAGKLDAEIAYLTEGLSWHADYNVLASEKSDVIDMVGWVTFDNESGKTFENAKIKLMAGDVHRVPPPAPPAEAADANTPQPIAEGPAEPAVTEKAFSEFHLYTIDNPTTLRDHETKQVEFIRVQNVKAPRIFVYDGASESYGDYGGQAGDEDYQLPMNKKVWVLREFKNSKENNLGMPLPAGRLRFYQQDSDDKQLEFIGENEIDHTPKDETIRVYVGNSFDLAGERRRTDFKVDEDNHRMEEAFEIKLRNHKKEGVEIRVVEHLPRYENWEIRDKERTDAFTKLDAQTVEFRVQLKPDEEKVLTYKVHYSW
ncbi:MAG TPA: DUF4139 domain-containing protein [Chthoniobacteraceae bacterium]|nr:DUF4139 domain-containing protein [Chthoniobacteraceae bacterium]